MQNVELVHDTLVTLLFMTIGLGTADQAIPFHDSTNDCEVEVAGAPP
jgi:hypothetical protein